MATNPAEATGPDIPVMFTPLTVRSMTMPNRIVMSPLCMYSAEDGLVGDWHVVHLGSRAMGGAGLVIAEMSAVHPNGRISVKDAGIWNDKHVAGWKRVVDYVHTHTDGKIGLQLGHAGRKGDTGESWKRGSGDETIMGYDIIAPTAIPVSDHARVPREITLEEIAAVPGWYVDATRRALEADFDMLEFHCAHGYLMSSFISPLSNHRTDAYGGPLQNRMRLPLEVFQAIRDVWPDDRPISVRISAIDWEDGGHEIKDAIDVSRLFHEAGADLIDVSSGMVTNKRPPDGSMFQVPFAKQIRSEAGVPTMAVGNIEWAEQMNQIIESGKADLCVIGRGHMYDPYLARHAAREIGYDMAWPGMYRRGARFQLKR